MAYPKLLESYYEDQPYHIRYLDIVKWPPHRRLIKEFDGPMENSKDTDGYAKLPSLCQRHVPSKQNSVIRVKPEELCMKCHRVAIMEDIDISEVVKKPNELC